MKKTIVILISLMLTAVIASAQKHTVSGFITDAASGEPIIGAAVIDKASGLGAISGNTGFYSISLEDGEREFVYSYLGYSEHTEKIRLNGNITLNISLKENAEQLENAVVTAFKPVSGARATQMSAIEVPVNQIKAIPAIGGEVDVIKALQLLPGVQSGSEGTAGMYVRGGGADENLTLMDGVPLYNANHLFGFFSVFNADAVKNVTLYKGSFPARFGGHLSSVIDVRLNDGNDNSFHGNVSVGLISSKFNFEGPIVKGKTTFNISARRTYLDLMAMPILWYINRDNKRDNDNYSKTDAGYDFYDVNAKITHKFNNGDRLSLSFYTGDDSAHIGNEDASHYEIGEYNHETGEFIGSGAWVKSKGAMKMRWKWGNMLSSLRWNHEVTPQIYMSSAINLTRYRSALGVGFEESEKITYKNKVISSYATNADLSYDSTISDIAAVADFDWDPSPKHSIKFGGGYTFHSFKPGIIAMKMTAREEDSKDKEIFNQTIGDKPMFSHEASLFIEDNWTALPWLKANLGLHTSLYNINGKTYLSAEPRVSARALIIDQLSAKLSYSEMSQYIHLLCNSNLSLPSDLWVPVTDNIKPMRSRQAAAGLFWDRGMFEFSIEAYYKTMDNVLEYKDGASFFSTATGWEEKVCMGRGWAYGVEFFIQKKIGKTTGWVGYTLARSMRQFDKEGMMINGGKPFPAKYDRTHDFSITVVHEFTKKFDLSASYVFASGNRGSLPTDNYATGSLGSNGHKTGMWEYFTISQHLPERNNFRMPMYHRLDIGMNFKHQGKHGMHIWNVSIYNAYNAQNPYLVTLGTHYEYDKNDNFVDSWPVVKQVSIMPILPSVSYTFKF